MGHYFLDTRILYVQEVGHYLLDTQYNICLRSVWFRARILLNYKGEPAAAATVFCYEIWKNKPSHVESGPELVKNTPTLVWSRARTCEEYSYINLVTWFLK